MVDREANVLITGGMGYIGSHTCVELLKKGYNLIIVDNLVNSKGDILDKIKTLGRSGSISFFNTDIRDKKVLEEIFMKYNITFVIHFAGLKSVNESLTNPLLYYKNNIVGTICLLELMEKYGCKKIIFSSSATVYGDQKYPVSEDCEVGIDITNPYGKTKYMVEQILKDVYISDNRWSIVILRYFNPVGCHPSGLIGEDPKGVPNNLFPYILRSVLGDKELKIYGGDYNTEDGTCIRDFIHVVDLAQGHVCAIKKLACCGIHVYNLGSGKGVSVLQLVKKFIETNKIDVKYKFDERRDGDLPIVYADVQKAYKELGWKTEKTLEDICRDGWNYIKNQQ